MKKFAIKSNKLRVCEQTYFINYNDTTYIYYFNSHHLFRYKFGPYRNESQAIKVIRKDKDYIHHFEMIPNDFGDKYVSLYKEYPEEFI